MNHNLKLKIVFIKISLCLFPSSFRICVKSKSEYLISASPYNTLHVAFYVNFLLSCSFCNMKLVSATATLIIIKKMHFKNKILN